jgi:hypothetical protein
MHRIVALASYGYLVDHINGDSLDNRSANLRLCNRSQNMRNRPKPRIAKASSQWKGVSFCPHKAKQRKPWRARIHIGDRRIVRLGYFADEESAALAYNEAANVFFGEFARLNEIGGCRADARRPSAG